LEFDIEETLLVVVILSYTKINAVYIQLSTPICFFLLSFGNMSSVCMGSKYILDLHLKVSGPREPHYP
jgi:hypothetical protein